MPNGCEPRGSGIVRLTASEDAAITLIESTRADHQARAQALILGLGLMAPAAAQSLAPPPGAPDRDTKRGGAVG